MVSYTQRRCYTQRSLQHLIIINMMTGRSSGRTADTVAAAMPSWKEKVARSVDDGNGLLHRHRKIDVNADQTSTGQAVEPSCTRVNMPQCERKCCFPLVGGLHRSLNDSPGLAATLPFPVWCHVNKSNTPSSMRTRVAGAAYLSSPSTSHRRSLNQSRKFSKQRSQLKDINIPAIALSSVKRLTSDFMKDTVVICDGGNHIPTINTEYLQGNVCILSISKGHLWVHDTTNPLFGLCMQLPLSPTLPVFLRLP